MAVQKDGMGFLVADCYRLLRRSFGNRLKGSPLTLAQARALVYISRHEGVRQVELAELLDVQPITLARVIDHLAGEGLVERRADPSDRRAFLVFLLPAASAELMAIEEVVSRVLGDALTGLDETEVATTMNALMKIRANLMSAR